MLTENNTTPDPLALATAPKPPLGQNNIYCTVDDFAEALQVSRGTVFAWIRTGMPSLSVGRTRRIIVARAYHWLEAGGADKSRRSARAKRATV